MRLVIRLVDAYCRRTDSAWAMTLRVLSPNVGQGYTSAPAKRTLDLIVGLPAVIATAPLIIVLAAINTILHPEQPALFLQHRVGRHERDLPIFKIRSMAVRTVPAVQGQDPSTQTYVTQFGAVLRRHFLDELPQLAQVVSGQLSLVGIRVLPWPIYRGLARVWSPERYQTWKRVYHETPLGLAGVHQLFRGQGKHDERRFHSDLFYARHASLGLDLYILWRTLRLTDTP